MKILKSINGVREIYDTENPEQIEVTKMSIRNLSPLHWYIDGSVFDFLESKFDEGHPVFKDFTHSYFYFLPKVDHEAEMKLRTKVYGNLNKEPL